ncbi:D-alanyl-D-alanine carboxypeptidase [Gryllotalpicola sp.]|uniref:D-alanyl-D-alanine carboxypeptidase family protein n=1 Tax=Gryllotalpicola sp. TaxID=1932787 RepID=UPI00262C765E|nr:D-alanyl-D-alanine carboxypeptidase [Gryllotalpicola sp.]
MTAEERALRHLRDARRRRIYARRRWLVFGTTALIVLGLVYVVMGAAAPLKAAAFTPSAAATAVAKGKAAAPAWPPYGEAAIGIVGQNGLIAQRGARKTVPIASITKTITALMVLKAKPIAAGETGPLITFTKKDVAILHQVEAEYGAWQNIWAGLSMTELDALNVMLVPSANNYAISLATWAYGSVPAYLTAANAWLAAQGLADTHLADASGLDSGSVSDAGDLVALGKLVAADPTLAPIVAKKHFTLAALGTMDNTNTALGVGGVDGIKTGHTDQAGYCLLFSASVKIYGQARTIVGVVLDLRSYDDLKKYVPRLVASIAAGYQTLDPTGAGTTALGTLTTAWGASTPVVAQKAATVQVYGDAPVTAVLDVGRLRPGTAAGSTVGTVTFDGGAHSVSVPLATTTTVYGPDYGWRLSHPWDWF